MILFISHPGKDYQDVIFYAFKKTFGKDVVVYKEKKCYFNKDFTLENCDYNFEESNINEQDIIDANKNGDLKIIFIIASGYDVHSIAKPLLSKLLIDGKKFKLIIIDGADGDRIQYQEFINYPCKFDLYFDREFHIGLREDESSYYPRQVKFIKKFNTYPDKIYPLPFSIIPEKFPNINYEKQYNVFFRCGNYDLFKSRKEYMNEFNYPNSIIDLNYSKVHMGSQDRNDYFKYITQSKVSLNITGGGNDCYRFWEILGIGGFVLSEKHDQIIIPRFKEGVHFDTFSNKKEMIDKIDYYVKNDEIREKIAKQGKEFVYNNHTCFNRMQYIFDIMKGNGYQEFL
jgi:hypothetical protein